MSWLHHADRSGCWLKYRLRASRPALHLGRRFTGCNTRRHRTRLHIVTRCYTLWHPNDVQTGNLGGIWFEAWSCNILSRFSCFSEIRRCAIAPSDRCLQRKRPCDTSAGGSNSLVDTRGHQPCTICGQFRKDWIWIYCWHLFTVFHMSEMLSRCFGKRMCSNCLWQRSHRGSPSPPVPPWHEHKSCHVNPHCIHASRALKRKKWLEVTSRRGRFKPWKKKSKVSQALRLWDRALQNSEAKRRSES